MKNLIEALRSGKLAEVRAAIKADSAAARHARVIGKVGRLAFQKAMELLYKNGADLNAVFRGYRHLFPTSATRGTRWPIKWRAR